MSYFSTTHRDKESSSHIDRPSLVEVVEQSGVHLRRAGKELVGLCPFHNEKTPSFSINPTKEVEVFYCHGCGAKGDVFGYVMQIKGVDFKVALAHLGLAGTSTPGWRPKARPERDAANIIADWAQETSNRISASMCEIGRRGQLAREAQTVPGTDISFLRDEVSRGRREWLVLETIQADLFNPVLVSELWSGREALERIVDG